MSAPTVTDTEMIAALAATPQKTTMVLLSCGCGVVLDGIHEVGEFGSCEDCDENVAIVQAFPGLDI